MKYSTAIMVGTLWMGASLLAPNSSISAEMDHTKMHASQYCTKHCKVMDLRKQLDALKAQITADKKAGTFSGGKQLEAQNKAKTFKEHLAQHEKEYADLEVELGKVEAELQ